MSDLKDKILTALDAVHEIDLHVQLVKMAYQQMEQPGPDQLDRVCLLLHLFEEKYRVLYKTSKTALSEALKEVP